MGFLPNTNYSSPRLGQPAQLYPPAQSNASPVSKTPAYSLGAVAGMASSPAPDKTKRLAPGMTVVQTGGDGEEKAVALTDLLVDPITRKKFDLDTPFTDRLLHLTPAQQVKLSLQHGFITLPKTIVQGLKGDNRFTFSDFLDVANIPYYLGGAVLAGSFLAGGDRFNGLRQGIGVGTYFLGIMASNLGINQFFKMKSGVDLNQKYRKPNGDIEKVFASVDFPRLDLLTEADYSKLARKMGIPSNVADPKREVNEQTRQIISTARADKLILGNLAAAIGAGFVARSELWARLLDSNNPLKTIWSPRAEHQGTLMNRLAKTNAFLWAKTAPALKETLHGPVGEASPWLRRSVWGSLAACTGLVFWHCWNAMNRNQRAYQSPFLSNLPPQLAPELSPETAAIQRNLPGGEVPRINRQSIFETVRNVEARTQLAATNPAEGPTG
jgi:hypothetical protein